MNLSKDVITSANAVPRSDYSSLASSLSCGIDASSLTCILGEHFPLNGSYMRMLGGVEPPISGNVYLYGEDSNEMDEQQRRDIRLKIGFVDVEAPLLSALSGYDNLKLPASYHGTGTQKEIEKRAEMLISAVEYDADHDVIPAYMTGLQKRHLIIARALMLEPSVLFIDRPLVGLDHLARRLIIDYITKTLKQQGLTILTANADMMFVSENADKIIFIGMGQTTTFDDWEDLKNSKNKDVIRFLEQEKSKNLYRE